MTLKEYALLVAKFVKENEELLDKPVFFSTDDEGNDFKPVIYGPSTLEEEEDRESGTCIN